MAERVGFEDTKNKEVEGEAVPVVRFFNAETRRRKDEVKEFLKERYSTGAQIGRLIEALSI